MDDTYEIVEIEEIGRRYRVRYESGFGGCDLKPDNHFNIALLYIATEQVKYDPDTMQFLIPPFSTLHSSKFESA